MIKNSYFLHFFCSGTLIQVGWPTVKVMDMPMPNIAISISAVSLSMVVFLFASSFVYCIILRKRGGAGFNEVGVGQQHRIEVFTIHQDTFSSKSCNLSLSNSDKSLWTSYDTDFDYRLDYLSELRRQAEIKASVLSLQTNFLLTVAAVTFIALSAFYENTICNVMASLIKTWTPIFTMVGNFHMIHEVVDGLKRNLIHRLDSFFNFFY